MKFKIKASKISAMYDGKFIRLKSGVVYKLVYRNEKDGYYIYIVRYGVVSKSPSTSIYFTYIHPNICSGNWELYDENPEV